MLQILKQNQVPFRLVIITEVKMPLGEFFSPVNRWNQSFI